MVSIKIMKGNILMVSWDPKNVLTCLSSLAASQEVMELAKSPRSPKVLHYYHTLTSVFQACNLHIIGSFICQLYSQFFVFLFVVLPVFLHFKYFFPLDQLSQRIPMTNYLQVPFQVETFFFPHFYLEKKLNRHSFKIYNRKLSKSIKQIQF